MSTRFHNPRLLLPRLLGIILLGSILLALLNWWSQPTIVGIWIGGIPDELCFDGQKALLLTRAKTWESQAFDLGCFGSYHTYATTPPMIVFPTSGLPLVFTYTVTHDLLVLQSTTGTYTLTPCLKATFHACSGADQYK